MDRVRPDGVVPPTSELPDPLLIKELYASFGLAYYHAEALHREMCLALFHTQLPPRDLTTRPRVDEIMAKAFATTMGEAAIKLKGVLPASLYEGVLEAVERRNMLAHRFWFDSAHLMLRPGNILKLIADLEDHAEYFDRLDHALMDRKKPFAQQMGLTDAMVKEAMESLLAGEASDPLPDAEALRSLRRLSQPQRLVRIWEFVIEDGVTPLVFELEDRSLWQLCDVGLGFTSYRAVGSDWVEHPRTKDHLPAVVVGRPNVTNPWEYEFTLANGVVMWVKPGQKEKTFKWGLRKPSSP